jgi:hypothetical protein
MAGQAGSPDINLRLVWCGTITAVAAALAAGIVFLGRDLADRLSVILGVVVFASPLLFITGLAAFMGDSQGPSSPPFQLASVVEWGVYLSNVGGLILILGALLQIRANDVK